MTARKQWSVVLGVVLLLGVSPQRAADIGLITRCVPADEFDATIADLTAWVKMGAPWPDEKAIKKNTYVAFDLAKRKAEHWCWQPIKMPAVKSEGFSARN